MATMRQTKIGEHGDEEEVEDDDKVDADADADNATVERAQGSGGIQHRRE